MSAPAAAASAASASPASPLTHASDDEESVPEGTGAGAAAGAGQSKAARKRKKRSANKAAAQAQQQQHPANPSNAHSHSHSHSHEHGGHGGHGGHSHSHGDVPCAGHGANVQGDVHAHVDPDDLSEATHFSDVCFHFTSYARHSFARIDRLQADFQTIPTVLQELVPGHAARMGELRRAVRQNHAFLNEIVSHRYAFHSSDDIDYDVIEDKVAREHRIDEERMSKVRATLRQCVRDWSEEGAAERAACYGPILSELERLYPDRAARSAMKVLIPGSGLGRLVWETAYLGFQAVGNEFSYQMLLAAFLILNCCKEKNIFTIYPYVHDSKNLYTPEDQLRAIRIPDVNPAALPEGGSLAMAAGDWMDCFSDLPSDYIHGAFQRMQAREKRRHHKFEQQRREWDAARREHSKVAAAAVAAGLPVPPVPEMGDEVLEPVADVPRKSGTGMRPSNEGTWDVFASCYFIDCATNILECLRTIAYVLKPGGYWINFGPLLYHFSEIPKEVSVDLSWAELRAAAPAFGLELVREQLEQPSAYTSDNRSMLRSNYYCVSCTWRKVGPDQTRLPASVRKPPTAPSSVAWNTRLAATSAGDAWTTLVVDASDTAAPSGGAASATAASPLASLLEEVGARRVREGAALPNGSLIDIFEVPSPRLGSLLLRAPSELAVGKVEVEGVTVLAMLRTK